MAYKSSPHKKTFLCFFMCHVIKKISQYQDNPLKNHLHWTYLCRTIFVISLYTSRQPNLIKNIFLLLYCSFCINNISNPTRGWSGFLVVTNFISQVKMKSLDQILLLLVGVSYYSTTVVVSFWCQRPCSWQLRKLLSSGCV